MKIFKRPSLSFIIFVIILFILYGRFIFWIEAKQHYFNVALRIKYSLKYSKDGDVDRIKSKMIKQYAFINPLIWTYRQGIKDYELYNHGLNIIKKIEKKEKIEKIEYDKTFVKRLEEGFKNEL